MKTSCFVLALIVILALTACGRQETLETVADEIVQPVMAQPREVEVRLPQGAVAPVLENGGAQLYMGADYEIMVETYTSGDLDATIKNLTGYDEEDLTVLKTERDGIPCYDFVWATTGERGPQLGRGVILDDGDYHYCLSVLRDADGEESQIVWSDVFDSFTLS